MTRDLLYCGVTSDSLLTKKAYADLIEPFEVRKDNVVQFLKRLAPGLKVEVFELQDAAGVAATEADINACVLTKET